MPSIQFININSGSVASTLLLLHDTHQQFNFLTFSRSEARARASTSPSVSFTIFLPATLAMTREIKPLLVNYYTVSCLDSSLMTRILCKMLCSL